MNLCCCQKLDSFYQKNLRLKQIQIMAFLFWFRGFKKLLKVQDNFDQTCACFINICSATEGKKELFWITVWVEFYWIVCLRMGWFCGEMLTALLWERQELFRVSSSICKELSFLTHLWFNWWGRGILICRIGNIHDSLQTLTFFPARQDMFWT